MTEQSIFQAAQGISDLADRAVFLELACGIDTDLRQRVEARLTADAAAGNALKPPPPAPAPTGKDITGPIFISYRRDDDPNAVDRIYEALKTHFPNRLVFRDIDDIPLGREFPHLLEEKLAEASVVLVVIGPRWVEILKKRMATPDDYVRKEVSTALASQATVIPVIVGGGQMPSGTDLADFPDLLPLTKRSGTSVRPGLDFAHHFEHLIKGLTGDIPDGAVGSILGGKYKLLGILGEGGMGTVYAAEQTDPVRRQVAVKLIKLGMDSKEILARFDAEQHALAVMNHPNIAKVLDAGMTSSGRPFFVMELVKAGVPITKFCDARKLPTQKRLELLVAVCHAVQHAHQKGIIHRDITPSNVLVEMVGDRPIPKVIDFGLAKAMGQKLTTKTLYSESGRRVGRFENMSPEQADGKHLDIDTRSDIYSLGVLLYELLTGVPPFSQEELERLGDDEMRRIIREVEPPIPSQRLGSFNGLPSIATNRSLEPTQLTKLIRGDLDWIAMKALEKDPVRRYQTALGLAEEVERYLANEVVQARPPSISYRAQKFYRRHRVPVIAAGLVLLALVAGITGTSIGMYQADAARKVAEIKEGEAATSADDARRAKGEAEEAAKKALQAQLHEAEQRKLAEAARDYTLGVLDIMTSEITGDSLATQKVITPEQKKFLTEVLPAYKKFAGEKGDYGPSRSRSAVSAYRVGLIQSRLGRQQESADVFRRARDGFTGLMADFPNLPVYRDALARSYGNLGHVLQGLGQWTEAEQQDRLALALFEQMVIDCPTVPKHHAALASIHINLGNLLRLFGKQTEAEQQLREAVAIFDKLAAGLDAVPEYRAGLAKSRSSLGVLLGDIGEGAEAERQNRKALVLFEQLATDFPTDPNYRADLAKSLYTLGGQIVDPGKRTEAEQQLRKAVAISERLVADFPTVPDYRADLAKSHANLGSLLRGLGKGEAEQQNRKALLLFEQLVADFPTIPDYRVSLATIHYKRGGILIQDLGKRAEAEEHYHQAVTIFEKLVADFPAAPKYHADLARSHNNLGAVLETDRQWSDAKEHYHQALAIREKLATGFPTVPGYRADLATSHSNLGDLAQNLGKRAEAEEHYHQAVTIFEKLVADFPAAPKYRVKLANGHHNMGVLLTDVRKWSDAEQRFRKSLEVEEKLAADFPAVPGYRQEVLNRLYTFACFYAFASDKVTDRKQEYADRAMELLQKTARANNNIVERMTKDTNLDPVRDRADFKILLRSLSMPTPKEKRPISGGIDLAPPPKPVLR